MAERILSGLGLGSRSYFRSPAYFYLLAFLEHIGRGSFWSPRIFQAILGSITASLSGLFIFRLLNKRWAMLVAGLIVSFFWLSVYFDGELLITSSAIFLNLVALYLLSFKAEKGLKWTALSGLASGFAIVFRPNFLLFSVGIFIFWLARKKYRAGLVLILATSLPIIPITIRNLVVAKDFVLIASQDGINFWIGNGPNADGRTVMLPFYRRELDGGFLVRMKNDPWFREDVWLVSTYIAEKQTGHPVKEGEVSRFWLKTALKGISAEPGRFLRLFFRKCYFLIDRTPVSNDRDEEYHRDKIPVLRLLGKFHLGMIMPFSLLGVLVCLRERKARYLVLYFFLYSLSIVAFFVTSRYRMKIFPELVIFSVIALSRLIDYIRNRRWFFVLGGIFLAGFFSWLSNAKLVDWNDRPMRSSMRFNLGVAMMEKGRYEQAIEVLKETVAIKPSYPEAHLALANALALSGRAKESIRHYQDALFYAPDFAEAHYNFGLTLISLQQPEQAYEQLLSAHLLKPALFPPPEQVLEELTR